MHTTTFSEMFPVDGDGYIIDTPGIKGFGTFDMEEEEMVIIFLKYSKFPPSANMATARIVTNRDVLCTKRLRSI